VLLTLILSYEIALRLVWANDCRLLVLTMQEVVTRVFGKRALLLETFEVPDELKEQLALD
jgi:hypothetical protein